MTLQAHPIRRIFARFFPRRYTSSSSDSKGWSLVPTEQRKDLALHYLAQGELALLQGNLNALTLFEAASQLDPANPEIWYRQGLAFFEYGSEEGKEKALLLASKNFKLSIEQDPSFFKAYVAWGDALLQLGRFHNESHFLVDAKEKYQKALELGTQQPPFILAELYWDYGIAWLEIANHSGEALDLRCAIDAFQNAKKIFLNPQPELYNDLGKAYLEIGFLINDSRFYLEAIEAFLMATKLSPHYFEGWTNLAESYSQLYLNTMDERFSKKAFDTYAAAIKISPHCADTWLSWSQILAEAGRLNKNSDYLRLSVEKCARAALIDSKNPLILAQWTESLASLGILTGRLDLLIEAEQKILKATDLFPDDPDLWLSYGVCLIAFGQYYEDPEYYEMAIEKLQWGLSIDRTSAEHWHLLGTAHRYYAELMNDENLYERANRFFSRAVDLKPAYPALTFDTAVCLFDSSKISGDLSSLEKSIALFESLLKDQERSILNHPEWLFAYASALVWLGDFSHDEVHFQKALEIYSHILLIDPNRSGLHLNMAICYMEIGHINLEPEYYKKAILSFRLSSRQDEENDQIWLDWGVCLIYLAEATFDPDFRKQLYWDAEQKLSKAGQLGNPHTYYALACLYSLLERTAEAMQFLLKAFDIKALPSLDELCEDEWLENLRATDAFHTFFAALETKMQQSREQ